MATTTTASPSPAREGSPPDATGGISVDGVTGRIERSIARRIGVLVDADPDGAVAVLRRWLREDR